MKKMMTILLLLICVSISFSQSKKKQIETLTQNKKELNASILRLQSDSAAMSNTLEEKERIILKNTNKIEELHSLTKSNISEIENLKKIITENEKLISHKNIIIDSLVMDLTAMNDSLTSIITENEKLISHKNIIIDSLVMDLTAMNDSLTSIIEANSIASESNWIITNLMGSLQGRWVDDCEYIGPETYKITIDKNYICMGMECGYGGSIKEISYDIYNGQYRIKFINDNDMAGDGLPGEFKFYYINNKLSFIHIDNKLRIFNKCKF